MVERVTRKNKNLDSTLPLTISAQDGLVDQNEYFTKTVASRNVSNYYLLKKGEFAYNKSYSNGYPLGAIKRLEKYEKGILSTLYVVFNPTYVNSDFLAKYYDSTHWYHEVYKHAAEGVRNHGLLNISPSDFFSTNLKVPKSYEEQSKIGIFINKLDNAIVLHQEKLSKLQSLKKATLQSLFPKNEKLMPEVRFNNFKEKWLHRKLGEILKSHTSKPYLADPTEKGAYQVIQQGDEPVAGYADNKPFEDYNGVTLFGDHTVSLYKPVAPFLLATDGVKILSAEGFCGEFLYTLLERYKPISQGYKRHFKILKNQDILFPKSKKEQSRIAGFFTSLEDSIILNQTKLEKLQTLKKAFLQKCLFKKFFLYFQNLVIIVLMNNHQYYY
ncbi:restriction endonuclease subunit S [Tetragenococcus muriaticus]|uniref:restriction endonuclease subunit S n=1 Tax=Tetragenococcus muriaticus TaxID=64642 RepID=UPI002F35B8CB